MATDVTCVAVNVKAIDAAVVQLHGIHVVIAKNAPSRSCGIHVDNMCVPYVVHVHAIAMVVHGRVSLLNGEVSYGYICGIDKCDASIVDGCRWVCFDSYI